MSAPYPATNRRVFINDVPGITELGLLRVGSRVKDCEGDFWRRIQGGWICEDEPDLGAYRDVDLLCEYGPVRRVRATR